jgi:hypothetical protein
LESFVITVSEKIGEEELNGLVLRLVRLRWRSLAFRLHFWFFYVNVKVWISA